MSTRTLPDRFANEGRSTTSLDVGCGQGRLLSPADRKRPFRQSDSTHHSRCSMMPLPAHALIGDARKLPFPDKHFRWRCGPVHALPPRRARFRPSPSVIACPQDRAGLFAACAPSMYDSPELQLGPPRLRGALDLRQRERLRNQLAQYSREIEIGMPGTARTSTCLIVKR